MTPEEAHERLRAICLEAWGIAMEQGWDCQIDARIADRVGWRFIVYTDKVRTRTGNPDAIQKELT